jgi:hypothetical protein
LVVRYCNHRQLINSAVWIHLPAFAGMTVELAAVF